jgi:nucleoside-diphosphate-sugar epimerase
MDTSLLSGLGWTPKISLKSGLKMVIEEFNIEIEKINKYTNG